MGYQYLTPEEQKQLAEQALRALPDPVEVQREAERRHYKQMLDALVNGWEPPPPFEPVDVKDIEAQRAPLETEIAAKVVEVVAEVQP